MRKRLLILGATGYLGTVATQRLLEARHAIVALCQPGHDAIPVRGNLELRHGDVTDPASLTGAVTDDIDGVLYYVPPTGDAEVDRNAIEALLAPLRGTGRLFMYVSGTWVLGPSGRRALQEDSPPNPIELVAYRPNLERQVLDAAAAGVRSVVVRAGVVHGRGGGIPAMLVAWAAQAGAGRYVGDTPGHWPMVHVEDLADLVEAVVERATPGMLLHAVAEPAVPVTELARAAAQAAGVSGVRPWPLDQAREALGAAFADALALDQSVLGEWTQRSLGWRPRGIDAVTDLATGSYRQEAGSGELDAQDKGRQPVGSAAASGW